MMRTIDLHTHSTASDGTFTPTEVVERAIEKKLAAVALTDHDTIEGVAEAMEAGKNADIEVIPGIELSCYYQLPKNEPSKRDSVEIHILGLYIDYTNEEFKEEIQKLKQARIERNNRMIQLFQDAGIPMTLEKLNKGNPTTVITRAHFARVLIEEGIVKTKEQAFNKYLGIGCPFYLPKPDITPHHVISLIRKAGGVPILAHPMLYKLSTGQIWTLIKTMKFYGVKGIEAYHSAHNSYQTNRLRSMANQCGMIISGGSDFHGDNKPGIDIGTGYGHLRVIERVLDNIKEIKEHKN